MRAVTIPSEGTALLLIDVINDLAFEGSEPLIEQAEPMARRLVALKRKAADAGVPVIYINDNFGQWRSDFRQTVAHCVAASSPGRRVSQRLRPTKRDYFVLKPKHSGFFDTTLDTLLEALRIRRVIVTGIAGNICVLFTANDAYMRELKLFAPSDCIVSNTPEENAHALRQMQVVLKANVTPSTQTPVPEASRLHQGAATMMPVSDINAVVGGLLRDLAFAQTAQPKMFGYKRAAAAVLALDTPLTELITPEGALPKIAGIGPGSARVIQETLETGGSPTVERAIDVSDRRSDIERRRALRAHFLSRAEVLRVLRDRSIAGPTLSDYAGDLQMHSEWSDGSPTVEDIAACLPGARLCVRRGHGSLARVEDRRRDVDARSGRAAAGDRAPQCQDGLLPASPGNRGKHRR